MGGSLARVEKEGGGIVITMDLARILCLFFVRYFMALAPLRFVLFVCLLHFRFNLRN